MDGEVTVDQLITRLQAIKASHGGDTYVALAATDGANETYALGHGGGIALDELDGHSMAILYASEAVTGSATPFADPSNPL